MMYTFLFDAKLKKSQWLLMAFRKITLLTIQNGHHITCSNDGHLHIDAVIKDLLAAGHDREL